MFSKGIGGIAIVILSAAVVLAAGFLLSGDSTTETRIVYDYTADITGLFTGTDEPEYLEYSPASNMTGWRENGQYWMSGVDYEPSPRATDYIVPQQDKTAVASGTVTGDLLADNISLSFGSWGNEEVVGRFHLVGLDSVIESLTLPDNAITLDVWTEDGGPMMTRFDTRNSGYEFLAMDPDTRHAVIDLNDSNKRTRLYDSNGELTATVALSQVAVFYGLAPISGDGFTYQCTLNLPLIYMDASAGVKITGSPVDWSNGYNNSKLAIVMSNGSIGTEIDVINVPVYGTDLITIYYNSGKVYIQSLTTSAIVWTWGSWNYAEVVIDPYGGTVEIRPITTFNTFMDYETAASGTVLELPYDGASVTAMTFFSATARLAIVDTWTYLDTTRYVYKDPQLDIEEYWTDDYQRVRFFGFAFLGDGVTIGGQSFPVSNGLITVDGHQFELNDLVITFNGSTAEIKTGSMMSPLAFDVEDRTIIFDGIWYFSAGYYTGTEKTVDAFGWTPGEFELSAQAAILLWFGVMIVGLGILAKVQKLGFLDIVICLAAGIMGFAMMEGFA